MELISRSQICLTFDLSLFSFSLNQCCRTKVEELGLGRSRIEEALRDSGRCREGFNMAAAIRLEVGWDVLSRFASQSESVPYAPMDGERFLHD